MRRHSGEVIGERERKKREGERERKNAKFIFYYF